MSITRNFNLMLYKTGAPLYINANQYDEGETWVFTLYKEDGTKYTPTTGAIVGIKSDGHAIANAGTVDGSGNVVITETQQMTAAPGRAIYEILIDNDTHGTANFVLMVEPRPGDNADLSDSDLSLIQQGIDAAETVSELLEGQDPNQLIEQAVDDWIDAHPEATTTVQDGAITAPKINSTLWDKLLVSEETSGNPASFDDGADDVPVPSLKVALEPIQTGSGDPSPTNIRPIYPANGKNMFDPSTLLSGYYADKDANDLSGSTTNYRTAELELSQGKYTISFSNAVNIVRYREKGISSSSNVATNVTSYTFTVSTNATVALGFRIPDAAWDDSTTIQIERGSVATFFTPYMGVGAVRTGKNLFDQDKAYGAYKQADGSYLATGNTALNIKNYIPQSLIGKELTASMMIKIPSGSTLTGARIGAKVGNTTINGTTVTSSDYGLSTVTFTPTSTADSFYFAYSSGASQNVQFKDVQLEIGAFTSYEPHTSTTYSSILPSAVYGGTVDLATGVLTVDKGYAVFDGSNDEDWTVGSANAAITISDMMSGNNMNGVSNMYQVGSSTGMLRLGINNNKAYIVSIVTEQQITTLEELQTFLSAHNLQVVYPLATPQTIQLTPTEVKTLLGYNNISSTGTVEVIYHADTQMYVDKEVSKAKSIIAGIEAEFKATKNYTTGDLLIIGDDLYKCTANIANGSTITVNTNVTKTTVAEQLIALA